MQISWIGCGNCVCQTCTLAVTSSDWKHPWSGWLQYCSHWHPRQGLYARKVVVQVRGIVLCCQTPVEINVFSWYSLGEKPLCLITFCSSMCSGGMQQKRKEADKDLWIALLRVIVSCSISAPHSCHRRLGEVRPGSWEVAFPQWTVYNLASLLPAAWNRWGTYCVHTPWLALCLASKVLVLVKVQQQTGLAVHEHMVQTRLCCTPILSTLGWLQSHRL